MKKPGIKCSRCLMSTFLKNGTGEEFFFIFFLPVYCFVVQSISFIIQRVKKKVQGRLPPLYGETSGKRVRKLIRMIVTMWYPPKRKKMEVTTGRKQRSLVFRPSE